ncbi:MAG: NAD(P) transhydrogenase subunit alpha [Firmicutes bacterium]|nr:NAD(P) transhydrogenase subunit alpha [Bacillota bacterium]HXL05070.1 NAD(P) transhydrogenase subunit alpha [Bacillota bacterium]
MSLPILLALFVVSSVIGYKVISDVPSLLHTPLMSGTNALSGVTVLGALTVAALAKATGHKLLGAVAIILAMINVVGGFLVTHRMLKMFKKGTDDGRRENVMG